MHLDTITISGLQADCLIGTYEWEQEVTQPLLFDIEISYDLAPAATSDDLRHAIDYAAISQRVIAFAEASHFQLIEALAVAVVDTILNEFDVQHCQLTLHKPNAVPAASDVSIKIARHK